MSAAATTQADVVLALCCECGEIRTVARCAAGTSGVRRLRCDVCKRTTDHATVGAAPTAVGDWREASNEKAELRLGVEDYVDLLRSLGADVHTYEGSDLRTVGIELRLDDGTFGVDVNVAADEARVRWDLEKAVDRVIRAEEHQWFVRLDDGVAVANIQFRGRRAR